MRAAFDAFMENGYSGTGTREIAARARVSKRELYEHFEDKHALLAACIASRVERMRAPPDLAPPSTSKELRGRMTEFGAGVLRVLCDPSAVAMVQLAVVEAARNSDVARAVDGVRAGNRKRLTRLVRVAQARGLLGKGDPAIVARDFLALLWGDLLLRLLLGASAAPREPKLRRLAHRATELTLAIHGNRARASPR